MPFIQDFETAYKEYEAGQIDFVQVPSGHLRAARTQPDFHSHPLFWTDAINVNWLLPPFDKLKVRLAFAEAIDVSTLDHIVMGGTVLPTHQWRPPGMPGYFADLERDPPWKFDPAQARRIWPTPAIQQAPACHPSAWPTPARGRTRSSRSLPSRRCGRTTSASRWR
jgi:ABC-type transport system substrate-binding protein